MELGLGPGTLIWMLSYLLCQIPAPEKAHVPHHSILGELGEGPLDEKDLGMLPWPALGRELLAKQNAYHIVSLPCYL